MKKGIILFSVIIVLILAVYYFSTPKDNQPETSKPVEESKTEASLFVSEKQEVELQTTFHTDGYGFIQHIYVFDINHYLVIANERNEPLNGEYTGNRLLWVTKKEKQMDIEALTTGDHMIHLELKESKPFFIAKGQFVFSFHEASGTVDMPMKGKGYIFHVGADGTVSKQLETTGVFHSFGIDEKKELVFVEKVEKENRNLYPSYFAPYTLHHRTWNEKEWRVVKTTDVVPDLQKTYNDYENQYKK